MPVFDHVHISVYQKAKVGNYYCGDSYYYTETADGFVCVVADGLGSGEVAKESSQAVIDTIKEHPYASGDVLVKLLNQALIGKRGVVLGILELDYLREVYSYTSIGNIGLMTIDQATLKKRNIPIPGYLGVYPRKMKQVSNTLESGMLFAVFSDGVHAKELSHVLFQSDDVHDITDQFHDTMIEKRDDDTTLLVLRYLPNQGQ
ncbi:negative regulator of sigma-B (phosphoserine phosphatase) [Halolactibacillus halophilus]|uniref:Negative regulator of sigma-B (Phosphoserine phosphatase) n=1 Tax=Halolactibacillus halophilus TaxID=306540 RepID=A0A1I5RUB9_9BACI|nr:SpoIIE family protein phosphatase [Halolactibacillus halophilus]GEM02318.1 phosphoserine phosphatase RsbX [Halolactibacillus halophilus]SFP61556.1 negative regulator of sigma-B (phosphoserine phosphatase) [Halolactibacillus halophilus]